MIDPPMVYTGTGFTAQFEGCKLAAYQDVKGVWTIGYGHTGPEVIEGLTCTQDQALLWLQRDIAWAANAVNNHVNVALTQGEFDALVDFTYNTGVAAFVSSTLLRLLNAGNFTAAAAQFELWGHAGGKVVAGLLRRRQAEEKEFDA